MSTTSTVFLEASKEHIPLPNLSKNPSSIHVDQHVLSQNTLSPAFVDSVEENKGEDLYCPHATPKYLSERTRRPSALKRADSDKTVDSLAFENPNISSLENSLECRPSLQFTSRIANRKLSQRQKRRSLIHFVSLCWCIWLNGWNDGTTGPILPRIQEQYGIGFFLVSMIFVANCFGYICGAVFNIWLNDRLGFGKIVVIGALLKLCGYAIIISTPPFPLLVCAYLIVGFGLALLNAQANGFVGSLRKNMRTKLGIMLGAYGLGAFTSPFSSTYFARFSDRRWSYHFIISVAFSFVDLVVLSLVFRFRRQEEILLEAGQESNPESTLQQQQQTGSTYRQIFSIKSIPPLAVFALIYIGVEVTLGGWIVTFIIHERGGGSNTGYISSGFFGGLTLGRLCLMWLNKLVGEHRIIFFYSLVAIGLELTVWFVPSIIENGVAVSLVGLLLGPMFPILVSHMTHILPAWLLTGCVGLVTGIGVAGSAALPFMTGLMASKFGIGSLQPLMVSMMAMMVIVWAFVPKGPRRLE